MATIKKYTKKDGSIAYQFQIYLGIDPLTEKKRFTTKRGFKSLQEAKIALNRLEYEVNTLGVPTSKPKIMTFKEISELWLENYKLTVKESTFFTQSNAIKNHIYPNFAELKIDKITPDYCQKIANKWHGYYKKFHNLIGLTEKIFDYAMTLKQITFNPMKSIVKPKKKDTLDKYEAPFYSKDELEIFLKTLEPYDMHYYMMFRLLAFTGLRKGELQALKWSDFQNGNIYVSRTLAKNAEGGEHFQTPKTKASYREISIDHTTKLWLMKWRTEQKKRLIALGFNANDDEQLIFSDEENNPFYLDYLNNFLKKFLKEHSLPKITVHGFRHTHCSLLFEAGASIKEVQYRLGHSDIKTTMDIYAHVTKRAKNQTADKFASYVNF